MEYINLGQISTITNGKRNAQDAIENGLYPLFDRSVIVKRSDKYMFDKEAIIVAGEGKTFLPKYYKGKFDLHQRCYAIFDFANGIHPKYIYYYIQWNQAYFQSVYTGSTVPSLRLGNFENMPVKLCTANHQEQIAINLDNINLALSKKQQELSSLDELVKSRFIEMFGDIVRNDKSWATEIITKVCPIKQYDGRITECDGKIWLLNLDLVESNTGVILDKYYVAKTEIGNSTITFSEDNVLYSKLRPYLNKVVVPDGNGYATSELIPFFPLSQVNKYYLAYALRSESFVTLINSKAGGAKMPRAPMDFIRSFPLPVPPIELQNEFAEFVKLIDKSKFIVQQQIKDLQELLDSKMDEYFR